MGTSIFINAAFDVHLDKYDLSRKITGFLSKLQTLFFDTGSVGEKKDTTALSSFGFGFSLLGGLGVGWVFLY